MFLGEKHHLEPRSTTQYIPLLRLHVKDPFTILAQSSPMSTSNHALEILFPRIMQWENKLGMLIFPASKMATFSEKESGQMQWCNVNRLGLQFQVLSIDFWCYKHDRSEMLNLKLDAFYWVHKFGDMIFSKCLTFLLGVWLWLSISSFLVLHDLDWSEGGGSESNSYRSTYRGMDLWVNPPRTDQWLRGITVINFDAYDLVLLLDDVLNM